MLNLILGLSGTGKTYSAYTKIKSCIEKGEKCLLIVPEQFTQGAEFRVFKLFSDAGSAFVTVCSFSGYAQRILKEYGGISAKSLTDAGRAVYVRRAMDAVQADLVRFTKHRRSPAFCQMCAEVITELKTAGATPDKLFETAENGTRGERIRELALVYKAYNALIENTALDTSDRIVLASDKPFLPSIKDVNVFVDNFDGFTFPEYRMLNVLLQAKQCTITLCCDSLHDSEAGMGLTSPVKATAARLRLMAARLNIAVASPEVLSVDYRHQTAPMLEDISLLLCGKQHFGRQGGEFYLNVFNSRSNEAKHIAASIAKLNREGVNFSEIAIICRLLDEYDYPLRHALEMYNIPYFSDSAKTVENTAVAAFLRSALLILKNGLNSEDILRLLKSGLCGYTTAQLAELENYAYTWRLTAQDWRQPFVKNPSGFGDAAKADKQRLLIAEQVRESAVQKIEKFLSGAKSGDVLCVSKQIYYLLDGFNAAENLLKNAELLEQNGKIQLADEMRRSWNLAMEFLSQMPLLLQNTDITVQEYDELLLILMRSSELGSVPQTQNAVMIAAADRTRLESPEYCFIIGSIEGEFPKAVGASGLLTHQDREALVQNGVDMPGSFEHRMLLEQMFFYKAVSAAKKGVFVSYVPAAMGGGELSAPLSVVVDVFKPKEYKLSFTQLCATPAAALETICEEGFKKSRETASVLKALNGCKGEEKAIEAMLAAKSKAEFKIENKEILREIFGKRITLSPTRIERYQTCKFAYFLEYVMRIKLRKKAELSPLESGSLVHYVLENVLTELKEGFVNADKNTLSQLCDKLVAQYIAEKMPDATLRFEKIIARIKDSVLSLLKYMQLEQAQSSFKPAAFEQSIGDDGIEPILLTTANGEMVRVIGKIDRVDIMRREGKSYIRVVDYKTGTKKFSLSDVFCGLNMQMLLYMFTVCKNGEKFYENPVQAGVLYLLADPSPKTEPRGSQSAAEFETDGILLEDEAVLRAMDKDAQGLFIPVKLKKDGSMPKSAKLASLEKMGTIENHINKMVIQMAENLFNGKIEAVPLVKSGNRPCDFCDYCAVCRHENGINEHEPLVPKALFENSEEAVQ